ncbi:MAG: hypothetical protein U0746_16940 [Gemmataceae bacterium]
MKSRTRRAAATVVVAGTALVLAIRPWGSDDDTACPEPIPAEVQRMTSDITFVRIAAKEIIANEVIQGRRTLFEAAALFKSLNQLPPSAQPPTNLDLAGLPIPTRTEEELLCWQVASCVQARFSSLRESRRAVARLAAEFRAEVQAHGTIRLPAPPVATDVLIEQAQETALLMQTGARRSKPNAASIQ